MRQSLNHALRSFVSSLTCAASGSVLIALMLSLYDIDRTMTLAVLPWALMLLFQALMCELMLSRGVNALVYLIVNGAVVFFGARCTLDGTVFLPASSGFPVLLGLFIVFSAFICMFAAQRSPGSDVFVRCADAMIILLALLFASVHGLGKALIPTALIMPAAALVLSILLAAMLRAGGESDSVIRGTGAGGFLVLLAMLAICLALTGALLSLGTGHVVGLVGILSVIWDSLCRAGTALLTLFARFLALFAINPQQQQQHAAIFQDEPAVMQGSMEAAKAAPEWVLYLFFAVIAGLILALIIAVLYMLRGKKLGRIPTKRVRRKSVTRKSHMLEAIRALLRRIRERISFEIAYRFGRRSPQKLLILAQRTGAMRLTPRRKSESGGAYLRRIHGILLDRGVPSGLDMLAEKLDRALYSNLDAPISAGEFDAYALQIRQLPLPAGKKKDAGKPTA